MAEYIERDALVHHFMNTKHYLTKDLVMDAAYAISKFPAADVVEVPCRCKDCKHWMDFPNCGCTDFVKVCALAEYMIGANGYCLYGERKDGE